MTVRSPLSTALPLAAEAEPARARFVRVGGTVLVGAWGAYLLHVLTGSGWGVDVRGFFQSFVFSGMVLAAGAMCLARARLIKKDRLPWGVLGGGMVSWGVASVYWSLFLKHMDNPPYPSIADALYLAFYPAAYIALMLLARRYLRSIGPSMWLDGLIGMSAVGAVGVAFVVPSVVADTGGSTAVVVTNLAYPLGDLLLIALVVGVFALNSWRPGRKWLLIGGGLGLLAIADSIYLYRVANGTFVEGQLLDAIWPAGMVLLAFSAWQMAPRSATFTAQNWPVLVVPSLFSLASLAVLIYGNVAEINLAALALAAITIVAALTRLALSYREARALSETRRQATTDELTGLANRRYLYERLSDELRRAGALDKPLTLLVADLDGFKELNDTLGHQAGDLLLRQVGPRILDALRASDTLARLGGDEFAVILPGFDSKDASAIAQRIQGLLDEPFTIRGLTIHMEASFGIASFPEHGTDVDSLVQRADVAMYQAKSSRGGYEVYAPERDSHSRDRLGLLGDLRVATETGQLQVHYQPKVDLATRQVTGVEALVRWHHPRRGLLGPMEFIPFAEHTSLMRPLSLYVLDTSLQQHRIWSDQGIDLKIAVNLSVPNLLDTRLPADVRGLLDKWEVPPEALQLEVTENIVMTDPERMIEVLGALREIGVGLSLDDFGTGSSSLAYLKRLPVDELKIDKSFVLGMEESEADSVIVRTTIELAQRLGLRVVAEGVETVDALEYLSQTGCEEAQGFYLQRPVPAEELTRWLINWHSASDRGNVSQEEQHEALLEASARVFGEQAPLVQPAES
jgi:diguanylate cyclase (GGDEF)-like protein